MKEIIKNNKLVGFELNKKDRKYQKEILGEFLYHNGEALE